MNVEKFELVNNLCRHFRQLSVEIPPDRSALHRAARTAEIFDAFRAFKLGDGMLCDPRKGNDDALAAREGADAAPRENRLEDDLHEAEAIIATLDEARKAVLLAVARELAPVSPAPQAPAQSAGTRRDPPVTSDG